MRVAIQHAGSLLGEALRQIAAQRWINISVRIVAAIFGGYALSSLASILLSFVLQAASNTPRADAVLVGLLLSFAIYAAVIVLVFTLRTAASVWVSIFMVAVALSVLALGAAP